MRPKWDSKPANSLTTMIDVDYYVDMRLHLDGSPVCLYTFTPSGVATQTENGSYWFNADNTVTLAVDGGAKYTHKLWDYEADELVIDRWWGSVVYTVESFKTGPNRRLIYFNPIRKTFGPYGWFIPGKRLTYRDVVQNGVARVRFERNIYLATAGGREQACISEIAVETATIRLQEASKPHVSDVERIFSTHSVPNHVHAASLFFRMFTSYSMPSSDLLKMRDFSYQSTGPLVTEDGKPSMRSIATPLLYGLVPVKSYNNDVATIKGRITEVRNNRPCPKECIGHREEFVKCVLDDIKAHGTLNPLDLESFRERLRPGSALAKKIDTNESSLLESKSEISSCFQKGEVYPKAAPPRNISTMRAGHNFRLGQYVYPLADELKKLDWYGPGKHPKVLATRVVMLCSRAISHVVLTDYTKLDGSTSEFIDSVYAELLTSAHAPAYTEAIESLLEKEANSRGYTQNDYAFLAPHTIRSGSSATSQKGTISNAFMAYSHYRGTGMTPLEAYKALGMYFGDDGISADVLDSALARSTARYGYLIKPETIPRGSPMTFLGRIFLNPFATPNSITDVARQLRKLHLTDTPTAVPREVILRRRALAYQLTDPNTPIISQWSDAIIRLTENTLTPDHIRNLAAREDSYWTTFAAPFFNPGMDEATPYVAENIGIDCDQVVDYSYKFAQARTIDDCFFLVKEEELKIEIPVVLDGTVMQPPNKPSHKEQVDKLADDKPILYCNDFRTGKCTRKQCKFRHEMPPVCRTFEKEGKCKYGAKCKYSH